MRCLLAFLLLAALVSFVIATPIASTTPTPEDPSGGEVEDIKVEVEVPPPQDDDLSLPANISISIGTDTSIDLPSLTTISCDGVPRHRCLPAMLSIGTQKPSIGRRERHKVNDLMWKVLNHLCPVNGKGCNVARYLDIQTKVWRDGKLRDEKTVARADRGHWGTSKGMRDVMFHALVGAVERMVLDEKNCYWEHDTKYCNIADFVSVNVDGMFIDIRFNGQPAGGRFDCVAILNSVHDYVGRLENDMKLAYTDGNQAVAKTIGFGRVTRCLGREVT